MSDLRGIYLVCARIQMRADRRRALALVEEARAAGMKALPPVLYVYIYIYIYIYMYLLLSSSLYIYIYIYGYATAQGCFGRMLLFMG